jgi:hypothetical protein
VSQISYSNRDLNTLSGLAMLIISMLCSELFIETVIFQSPPNIVGKCQSRNNTEFKSLKKDLSLMFGPYTLTILKVKLSTDKFNDNIFSLTSLYVSSIR